MGRGIVLLYRPFLPPFPRRPPLVAFTTSLITSSHFMSRRTTPYIIEVVHREASRAPPVTHPLQQMDRLVDTKISPSDTWHSEEEGARVPPAPDSHIVRLLWHLPGPCASASPRRATREGASIPPTPRADQCSQGPGARRASTGG